MLAIIWITSLVLSAIALLIMLALILRRVIKQRRAAGYAELRQNFFRALIVFSQEKDEAALKTTIQSMPPRVAIDGGFEFLELLRGDEHAHIARIFAEAGLPEYVAEQLRRGNEAARIHAAEMLAILPDEQTVASLLDALDQDRSREVRIAAAIGLCLLDALPPLSIVLRKIGVDDRRTIRLIELFKRYPADRMAELRDYARRKDGPGFVRAAAIEAMASSGEFALADDFALLARDASSEVSAAAIRALGQIGHPNAVAIVSEAMTSKDWEVRADAAEAAGRLGRPDLFPSLTRLLDDDAWMVRYAAAKAIRAISPQGERMLQEMASAEPSPSQRTASLVLSEGVAA